MTTNLLLKNNAKKNNTKKCNTKKCNIKKCNTKKSNKNNYLQINSNNNLDNYDCCSSGDSDLSNGGNTTNDDLLQECIICFEYITSKDEYYFCQKCSIPAHKKCCQEWWFNQYKKQGQCVHCQTKNELLLFKPHVEKNRAYRFVLYLLRKIGCYS